MSTDLGITITTSGFREEPSDAEREASRQAAVEREAWIDGQRQLRREAIEERKRVRADNPAGLVPADLMRRIVAAVEYVEELKRKAERDAG